jgi:hypothetical protein
MKTKGAQKTTKEKQQGKMLLIDRCCLLLEGRGTRVRAGASTATTTTTTHEAKRYTYCVCSMLFVAVVVGEREKRDKYSFILLRSAVGSVLYLGRDGDRSVKLAFGR